MNEEQERILETSHFNDGHGEEFEEQKVPPGTLAVDLDGTLAEYHGWKGNDHIGAAIPEVLERMLKEIASGRNVIIFTARMSDPECIGPIRKWLAQNDIPQLAITNIKYKGISEFWDDRAKEVIPNTGIFAREAPCTCSEKSEFAKELELYTVGISKADEKIIFEDDADDNMLCKKTSAFEGQVGGQHYSDMLIQPMEYCFYNKIDYMEASVIKYVSRIGKKDGIDGAIRDIDKSIDVLMKIKEVKFNNGKHLQSLINRLEQAK